MTTSNEHNNGPAVPQGLERYEPTVMVEESRGRLTATGAVMKPKEDGRWVRLRDLTATPAPAPAQERCSTCGYLTSEREHLGCLRRAVKDLDIATGGPYDAQEVVLTDEERADMACAVAAICTGASSRTVAATAIDWTERALRAKGGK